MKKENKGFTLIELIIVIAILAITLTVTSDILISLVRSNNKTRVQNELEQQSNFVALKLEKELRDAGNIINAGSDELTFTNENGDEITYLLTGSPSYLQREGVPITSPHVPGGVSVTCPSGCFEVLGISPQRVNISLLFEPVSSGGVLGTSFSGQVEVNTTVVLRNTY